MKNIIRLAVFLSVAMVLLGSAGHAQGTASDSNEQQDKPALLVADSVFITSDKTLVAEGNVEAFQGDTRLRASRITFERENDTLTVEGPIRIDEGGSITVLADFAELDKNLQNGLLTGARMVLDQQLQLAALQMTRVRGRYTQLYKTAVTSCRVCGSRRPPLWQIRARKITHDQQERQLYFEDAQFLIRDVPVMYFPGMRLPDPTLKRATGFLIPSIRSTSNLGTGIKVPYFFKLGDHADLTLSPYYSPSTRTLEYRFRRAFRRGRISFDGAYTRDDLIPNDGRGYLFGTGSFQLNRGYRLDFRIETASDNAYLFDYGLPYLDRLRSEISVSRFKSRSAFRTRLINFETLRDADNESELPTVVFNTTLERRFFPDRTGGEWRVGLDLNSFYRTSDADILGRDVSRASTDISWRRSWIFSRGLRADWEMGVSGDLFFVRQDSNFPDRITRTTPRAALKFSYPMTKTAANGALHLVEPVFQFGWTDVNGPTVPNDESRFVEFDQGNLLSLSRFPANDRREDGVTAAYGLNYYVYGATGWQASASVGQVVRRNPQPDFTVSSGLTGTTSDVLVAGQLQIRDKLTLTARTLLDNAFSLSKAELRGDWRGKRARLNGTYLWLGVDAAENRSRNLSEIYVNGEYDISRGWMTNASLRYDVSDNSATRAGLGLIYRNECVTVDLRVNRRYTTSTSIEPSTDFGFSVSLGGFSVDQGTDKYTRSCS